jgi:hypothetical protein
MLAEFVVDNVWGHMVNSSGGTLCTQHQLNLQNVMQVIYMNIEDCVVHWFITLN